ncbi:hypothetical protein [Chitiniphilus shinanonensis]|uniref:hypothetical protein n=1 Tax=Chitiniphilus shinanonensis TaxID=553088 RepID=UPI0012FC354C|nr:hypothetical protein [Chitiniphilus shinanonensis]
MAGDDALIAFRDSWYALPEPLRQTLSAIPNPLIHADRFAICLEKAAAMNGGLFNSLQIKTIVKASSYKRIILIN